MLEATTLAGGQHSEAELVTHRHRQEGPEPYPKDMRQQVEWRLTAGLDDLPKAPATTGEIGPLTAQTIPLTG